MFSNKRLNNLELRVTELENKTKEHNSKLIELKNDVLIEMDDSKRDNSFSWCDLVDKREVTKRPFGSFGSWSFIRTYQEYCLSIHTVYRTMKLLFDYFGIKVEQKDIKPARIVKKGKSVKRK